MDKKITYVLIAALLVIVVAGVAVAAMGGDDSEKVDETADDVTFLIQDDDGVYFWAFGEGKTVMDAFKDAAKDMPFTASSKDGVDDGIGELFGLKMHQEGEKWFWWTQYTWTNDAWVMSNLMMNNYTPEEAGHYVACVFGDGTVDLSTLATPKDAVVWDKDTAGVTFTIQNGDNLYFKINGEGKTVYDAFKAAATEYKVKYTPSVKDGKEYGIDVMFGLEMTKEVVDGKDVWHYWSQFYKNASDADWKFGEAYMNGIESSTYSDCMIKFV